MCDDEGKELFDQDPDLEEDFGRKEWPFSSTGGLDEIPMPSGSACVQLSDVLGKASEHSGDFSFGGLADQLPAVPGLFVDGIGPIPVPLWEERALKLIEKCEKSPFGHNFATKLDENVRKSWQLPPDQVELKNPQWQIGMEKMTTIIAEQLGYNDVPLQCVLYKLLVYEEGGHFIKHQDTEKEDGMIATLVIQPPSLHEGGDLLVYADGEVKHRHDFGKSDGTATYLPHFAVHYADAEHAVEKVTKGYRLVLVYSVCLPSAIRYLERNPNKSLVGELAEIIETMGAGDNSFALLLSHEYTDNSITRYGSRALKGVDRARFLALEEANASVSDEKKLDFLIAKLNHNVVFYGSWGCIGDWNEKSRDEKVSWYTTDGKNLGFGDKVTVKFNFLNPIKETRSQLWKKPFGSSDMHGYMGNEGPTKNSVYARYAIIAWPWIDRVENMVKFVNLESAFRTLEKAKQIPATSTLCKLMDIAATKVMKGDDILENLKQRGLWSRGDTVPVPVSRSLCQTLYRLLEMSNDPALVNLFFRVFLKHLPDKSSCAYQIATILKKYNWNDIGQALLEVLAENDFGHFAGHPDYLLSIVLEVARKLPLGDAQTALLKVAVEKAEKLDDDVLDSLHLVANLWKLVLDCGKDDVLEALLNRFKSMSPRLLKSTVSVLSKLLTDTDLPDDRKAMLVTIVHSRSEWLSSQIRVLEKPFTWEMPVAEFPDNAEIEIFLRGSDETMSTQGVVTFEASWRRRASNFVSKYTNNSKPLHKNASFNMTTSADETFVTISKTRKWYETTVKNLEILKDELEDLKTITTDTLVTVILTSRKNK